MQIRIGVSRSQKWLNEQRIAKATNLPSEIVVTANLEDLSEKSRSFILEYGGGYYSDIEKGFWVDSGYRPAAGGSTDKFYPLVDADPVSPPKLDLAIIAMILEIEKAAVEKVESSRRIQAEALARKEAAEAQKAKVREAETILADTLAEFKLTKERLEVVSAFISRLPPQVLSQAIKDMARENYEREERSILNELRQASSVSLDV